MDKLKKKRVVSCKEKQSRVKLKIKRTNEKRNKTKLPKVKILKPIRDTQVRIAGEFSLTRVYICYCIFLSCSRNQ